jgi:hypothetical protein
METLWITNAEYVKNFEIKLKFNDGTEGTVDLKNDLSKPIFEPLKDIHFFKSFKLGSWTIEWENGADFAPEFLYKKVNQFVV